MEKQVKYLGYIDKKEITALYKASIALSMPTYFGPTCLRLKLLKILYQFYIQYSIVKINFLIMEYGSIDLKDPKTLSLQIEKILKNDGAKDENLLLYLKVFYYTTKKLLSD